MKLLVPELRAAFSGQLTQAALPAHALNMWLVPVAEIAVGLLLTVGLLSRLASLGAVPMMVVAAYVHLDAMPIEVAHGQRDQLTHVHARTVQQLE